MNSFAQRFLTFAFALVLLAGATLAHASGIAQDLSLTPEWRTAVEPLRRMPVQDAGFVRTAYTFSGNFFSAIAGARSAGKADALEGMLTLLRDPKKAQEAQVIKLSHPELIRLFGSQFISVAQWHDDSHREALIALLKTDQEKWTDPLNTIEYRSSLIEGLDDDFAIVPRAGEWLTPEAASHAGNVDATDRKILEEWTKFRTALAADDAAAGGAAARELSQAVVEAAKQRNVDTSAVNMDYFYHKHQPFRNSAALYLIASLVYAGALMMARPRACWIGYALLVGGFVEQVIGVSCRWMLAGRAPLSNMYESFTFAVGGMVLVALIMEAVRTTRVVGMGASVLGFVFMVIAHKSPIFDSQIRPLVPALQSSWLTYHVITIMLSYSAFALSFFVSGLYLTKNLLLGGDEGTNVIARRLPSLRALDLFTYRIIGVGFPLLSLGIIFGAVWAATAWGRPWGFDPKETWSAITWLVYAIYLHVRYLAGWTGRRAAILSLVGFIAVLFTYLGVNYLLPGLHSYV